MKKLCPNCNELIKVRIGKIYCNNYCKSNYHYEERKKLDDSLFSKIDKQLKLNRRLLSKFNQSGKSTIRKEKLIEAGFIPKFHTHHWRNQKGEVYYFCFDLGFLELQQSGKTKYLLIEYQEKFMGIVN
jgi:hypothetical protein